MRIAGIVAEYNPFHQGHIHHLEETRKLLDPDVLVVVISEWFSQRGLPSLMTPADKARMALQNGADLVIGLPACCAAQSADYFAKYALQALYQAGVQTICFGSETGDLAFLQEALKKLENLEEDPSLSQMRNTQTILPGIGPNDLLGIQYLKWCEKLGMNAVCIPRNQNFISATKTRADYFGGRRVYLDSLFLKKASWNSLYPLLRASLLMSEPEDLAGFLLCSEGIENRLIKAAAKYASWDEFLEHVQNKSYSRARVQRTCLFILLQMTWKQMEEHDDFYEVIVLGANEKGRAWLKILDEQAQKEDRKSNIYSTQRQLPDWLFVRQQKPQQLMEIITGLSLSAPPVMIDSQKG